MKINRKKMKCTLRRNHYVNEESIYCISTRISPTQGMSNHSSTPGWAKLKRSTDLSSSLRRRQRIYDQDINNNKTKSKSKSFKHFAKSTLAQGAQKNTLKF